MWCEYGRALASVHQSYLRSGVFLLLDKGRTGDIRLIYISTFTPPVAGRFSPGGEIGGLPSSQTMGGRVGGQRPEAVADARLPARKRNGADDPSAFL